MGFVPHGGHLIKALNLCFVRIVGWFTIPENSLQWTEVDDRKSELLRLADFDVLTETIGRIGKAKGEIGRAW